ncbi:small capsid protein [Beluga whale alphaherpesvirus 1]|uniref:Small capsomere-interacting protein n=1 Tax=Beluga whale alphaherpesvirus 1 TaxID=1434720 RepID=A0A286MM45_9ALPH|nr:small capsid protein [Beluga whale alphaherpesvirus 1]ASW27071.1 small capsid protein [Beluga whale alphaherpesvirus 1]
MASFNVADPRSFTPDSMDQRTPEEILRALNRGNAAPDWRRVPQAEALEARRALLIGISLGMVTLRHRHEKNTLPREEMFAVRDPAEWARVTIGLKRTFSPRTT